MNEVELRTEYRNLKHQPHLIMRLVVADKHAKGNIELLSIFMREHSGYVVSDAGKFMSDRRTTHAGCTSDTAQKGVSDWLPAIMTTLPPRECNNEACKPRTIMTTHTPAIPVRDNVFSAVLLGSFSDFDKLGCVILRVCKPAEPLL